MSRVQRFRTSEQDTAAGQPVAQLESCDIAVNANIVLQLIEDTQLNNVFLSSWRQHLPNTTCTFYTNFPSRMSANCKALHVVEFGEPFTGKFQGRASGVSALLGPSWLVCRRGFVKGVQAKMIWQPFRVEYPRVHVDRGT